MSIPWTEEDIRLACEVLSRFERVKDAAEEIEQRLGRRVTSDALKWALKSRGMGTPQQYTKPALGLASEARDATRVSSKPQQPNKNDLFARLVQFTKRSPMTLEQLCDRLDMSPSKLRQLIEQAKAQGYDIAADDNGFIGMRQVEGAPEVVESGIAPVTSGEQRVAVISDTHLGSKYCLREQLKDFVHSAYDKGVRQILHPGDVLDGCYRHGKWEVTHPGLDDQIQDLFDVLPQLPGLTYHCIEGNHDNTFRDEIGLNVGANIEQQFRSQGRGDVFFYGSRSAFIRVAGVVFELWHPRGGTAYALSYALQNKINSYEAIKPQILLVGHYHQFCYVHTRGVHGMLCPTFQGSGSSFSKSLRGTPSIGGLMLSWELTNDGTIRDFGIKKRSYYEREEPVSIHNRMDGQPVRPALYVPSARLSYSDRDG